MSTIHDVHQVLPDYIYELIYDFHILHGNLNMVHHQSCYENMSYRHLSHIRKSIHVRLHHYLLNIRLGYSGYTHIQ